MSTKTSGALAAIEKRGGKFIVITDDPELYDVRECTAMDVVQCWVDIQFGEGARVKDIDPTEHAAFVEFADDTMNWRDVDGEPTILQWEVGGESPGTVTFYRRVTGTP